MHAPIVSAGRLMATGAVATCRCWRVWQGNGLHVRAHSARDTGVYVCHLDNFVQPAVSETTVTTDVGLVLVLVLVGLLVLVLVR